MTQQAKSKTIFKVLGVSASLRNARRGLGNVKLIEDINAISNKEQLNAYLTQEATQHLANFKEAGRVEGKPFDQMYKDLRKLKGDKGLSNSEVLLTSALWHAKEIGAQIDHVSLSEHFNERNEAKNIDELKRKVIEADALLVSGPVYFGDRGSLAQTFIEMIKQDPEFHRQVQGKIYAGLAVGAKRNGGQETTLIYQLFDMINMGLLGVGNDSETTSQYGGTGLAGDVGTMQKDDYGLATADGTGRRIARVARMMKAARGRQLQGKHRVLFWLLQDRDDVALNYIKDLISNQGDQLEAKIMQITQKNVLRCLACDICPTHVAVDEEYRCIIKSKNDDFQELHDDLMDVDAIIPVAFSPKDAAGLVSNYQRFIERTRYLRRGDYVFSDLLTAPLVIQEVGSNENLAVRMMTSSIRHHTVLARPMVAIRHEGAILNDTEIRQIFAEFNTRARTMAAARITGYISDVEHLKYNPVGYILSAAKNEEDEKLMRRKQMLDRREEKVREMEASRLEEEVKV